MLQAAARERHLAMPMASQALTLYRLLVASGKCELDAAAVILEELPARTKEVFLLNRMDGLTYTQLATRFEVSVGTIEKQVSRALGHIRARMDQDA